MRGSSQQPPPGRLVSESEESSSSDSEISLSEDEEEGEGKSEPTFIVTRDGLGEKYFNKLENDDNRDETNKFLTMMDTSLFNKSASRAEEPYEPDIQTQPLIPEM